MTEGWLGLEQQENREELFLLTAPKSWTNRHPARFPTRQDWHAAGTSTGMTTSREIKSSTIGVRPCMTAGFNSC